MCGWVALADVFEDTDWVCVGGWHSVMCLRTLTGCVGVGGIS